MPSSRRFALVALPVAIVAALFVTLFYQAYASSDVDMDVPDPAGDTFGQGLVEGAQPDISAIRAVTDGSSLVLTIEFEGGYRLPTPHGITLGAVVGVLDFDTDLDPATGLSPSHIWARCPGAPAVTMDRYIYIPGAINPSGPPVAEVIDATSSPPATVATVPVEFESPLITMIIPLSALGGDDLLGVGAVVGTYAETTDCAPGDGGYAETLGFQVTPVATATGAAPTPTATVAAIALPDTGDGDDSGDDWALLSQAVGLSLAAGAVVVCLWRLAGSQ
jgi:hypothetical protein